MKLSKEAREAQRAYKRQWCEKNREHLREYHRRYNRNNKEKMQESRRLYWERKAKRLSGKPGRKENVTKKRNDSRNVTDLTPTNICQECGISIDSNKKYCSGKCRQKAYRKRKKLN